MSYNSRAPSNIGMISTTVNCRTSVTHWTEAEKEKWLAGVKDGALDAMNTMSEHMETGKSPEDCHAFMDLIHEHAGKQFFHALRKFLVCETIAKRNDRLAKYHHKVMTGQLEQEVLKLLSIEGGKFTTLAPTDVGAAAVSLAASGAGAKQLSRDTKAGPAPSVTVKRGRPPGGGGGSAGKGKKKKAVTQASKGQSENAKAGKLEGEKQQETKKRKKANNDEGGGKEEKRDTAGDDGSTKKKTTSTITEMTEEEKKYIGVILGADGWYARSRVCGKETRYGPYPAALEAALAYDQVVRAVRGPNAKANFLEDKVTPWQPKKVIVKSPSSLEADAAAAAAAAAAASAAIEPVEECPPVLFASEAETAGFALYYEGQEDGYCEGQQQYIDGEEEEEGGGGESGDEDATLADMNVFVPLDTTPTSALETREMHQEGGKEESGNAQGTGDPEDEGPGEEYVDNEDDWLTMETEPSEGEKADCSGNETKVPAGGGETTKQTSAMGKDSQETVAG